MTRNQELYLELRKKDGVLTSDAQDPHDAASRAYHLSAAWHKLTVGERRELFHDWGELAWAVDASYPSP